jgi:hypothetical protein
MWHRRQQVTNWNYSLSSCVLPRNCNFPDDWMQWTLVGRSAMWEWSCNATFQRLALPSSQSWWSSRPLLSGFMITEVETVTETSDYNSTLIRLSAREHIYITYTWRYRLWRTLAGWAAAAGSLSRLNQTVLGCHVVSTSNPTAAFSAF